MRARRPLGVRLGRTAIVVEVVAALAFVGYLLHHEGVRLPFSASPYEVKAEFADASGLSTEDHSQVTVAGVPLGRVSSVSYRDGVAVATLSLDPSVNGKLHAGTSARIVPRSALQDLTVDLEPGPAGAPALAPGAVIRPPRTSTTVASDRLVDVLDADTRAQIEVLSGELERGLEGRSATLRADFAELDRTVGAAAPVTAALAARRHELAGLVTAIDGIVAELARRRTQLADAIDAGRRTLDVTGARDRELAATLRVLPGALQSTTSALERTAALAHSLDPTLAELRGFARRLPGAEAALRRFVPAGTRLVGAVGRFEQRDSAPLADLASAASGFGPAAQSLRSPVARAVPLLRAFDRHKDGIGKLGDRFSGVFSTNDANGPILRGLGFFEPLDPGDLGFDGASKKQAAVDSARALTRLCLTQNPVACLARYLVPGLPGAVRGAAAKPAGRHS
jgi:phospholipid/cholesterol/gamma-HCH transport system substrate-binding protein